MIYERLALMRDLMHSEGTIYIHMGSTVNYLVRTILDELFGRSSFINEIVWKRRSGYMGTYNKFGNICAILRRASGGDALAKADLVTCS